MLKLAPRRTSPFRGRVPGVEPIWWPGRPRAPSTARPSTSTPSARPREGASASWPSAAETSCSAGSPSTSADPARGPTSRRGCCSTTTGSSSAPYETRYPSQRTARQNEDPRALCAGLARLGLRPDRPALPQPPDRRPRVPGEGLDGASPVQLRRAADGPGRSLGADGAEPPAARRPLRRRRAFRSRRTTTSTASSASTPRSTSARARSIYLPRGGLPRYFERLRSQRLARLFHARLPEGESISTQLVLLGPHPVSHTVSAAADAAHLQARCHGVPAVERLPAALRAGRRGERPHRRGPEPGHPLQGAARRRPPDVLPSRGARIGPFPARARPAARSALTSEASRGGAARGDFRGGRRDDRRRTPLPRPRGARRRHRLRPAGLAERRALRGAAHFAAAHGRRHARARGVLHGERLRARLGPARRARHDSRTRLHLRPDRASPRPSSTRRPVLHILGQPPAVGRSAVPASGPRSAIDRWPRSSSASSTSAARSHRRDARRGLRALHLRRARAGGRPGSRGSRGATPASPGPLRFRRSHRRRPRSTTSSSGSPKRGGLSFYVGQGAFGAAERARGSSWSLCACPVVTTTSGRGVLSEDHPVGRCPSIAEAPRC